MEKMTYEKPKAKFVSLQNQENVAEQCWGTHGKNQWYYDTIGEGFVSFYISDGSCTTESQLQVVFYENKHDTTGEILGENDPKYQEVLYKILDSCGGSSYGQNFKGDKDFPNNPGGMS